MSRYVPDVAAATAASPASRAGRSRPARPAITRASPVTRDQPRAWVGVVSRAHVLRGVEGGFAQLCHGKHGPLARMATGDWLVYYSPTTEFGSGAPLRAFTALGRVSGEQVYRFDMGDGFVPHRRDVAYERVRREAPIHALAPRLAFVRDNPRWGMLARRGHFEIDPADLAVIADALGVTLPRAGQ